MPDPELQRTLQSLALGKYRILQKAPKGRDVNPTDTFTFNDSFTCPLARFKIMQVVARVESAKEREETQEMVDEERRHQVEVSTPSGAVVDVSSRRVLSGS
jgi:cullin 3